MQLRAVLALLIWLVVTAVAQRPSARPQGGAPPAIGVYLYDVLAKNGIREKLPLNTEQTYLISCTYTSQTGGSPITKYFWYSRTPPWLAQIPQNSAVRRLIPSMAERCPSSVTEANAPAPELPSDAATQMGVMGHAAVFATPLRSNLVIRGKWIEFRPFKKGDDQYLPSGPKTQRMFTDTDMIEIGRTGLTVIPLKYVGDQFCLEDPLAENATCFQIARYEKDLAVIQPRVRDNAKFDLIGVVHILDSAPVTMPSDDALNSARAARMNSGFRVQQLKAEDGFTSLGLKHGRALMDIHDGSFDDASKKLTMLEFLGLIDGYIAACSTSPCARKLPAARKVQLTASICGTWETQTIGRLPPSTYCKHEATYLRNAFAARDMLDFRQRIGQMLAPYIAGLMSSEAVPNSRPMEENLARALKPAGLIMSSQVSGSADMQRLLQQNVCDSVGLQTFEQNLTRFGADWFKKLQPFER